MTDLFSGPLAEELSFAVDLVRDCCGLASKIQKRLVIASLEKEDRSPVTVADFAVQALVGWRLSRKWTDARLVAEESADFLEHPENRSILQAVTEQLREFEPEVGESDVLHSVDQGGGATADRYWVLDPIDGTKGFLRDAHYAVAFALIEQGVVQLGVLGCPRLDWSPKPGRIQLAPGSKGTIFFAAKGRGAGSCSLEGNGSSRLQVSPVSKMTEAVLVRSVESGHTNLGQVGQLAGLLGLAKDAVPMDSQAKYALLAGAEADLLVRLISPKRPGYKEKIWDQAAGVLVVEEAGGKVTDLDGKPLDFSAGRQLENNRGVAASNGRLHERLLWGLRELGA